MWLEVSGARVVMVFAFAWLAGPSVAGASESVTASVAVTAEFASRTSFKVSTDVLRFEVTDQTGIATAEVDFTAAAVTRAGGEVTLSVEAGGALEGPAAAGHGTDMTVSGTTAGTTAGAIVHSSPSLAARWIGSGVRAGRLIFTLRAATIGRYTVPVHFVLSAP